MNKKQVQKQANKMLFIMLITLLIFCTVTFYPAIRNGIDKSEVREEINREIEYTLSSYKMSDDYKVINPSVQSDMDVIKNSVDSTVTNVEEIEGLFNKGITSSPYLYIAKQINNNEYEVFEAYANITINPNDTFTSNYQSGTKIFTYESGKFTSIKTDEYNKRLKSVGNREVTGKVWFILSIIIFGISFFILFIII